MPDHRELAPLLQRRGYSGVKKIGEGSFGVAVLVEDGEGSKMVVKVVDVSKASSKETAEARKEGRLLAQIKHPYIVRYRENFAERGWLCIVMDFCDGGDLMGQIDRCKKAKTLLPEDSVLRWLTQCILALKYLHGKHILHRDLKPSNVFMTKASDKKDWDTRLGDFGISKVMNYTGAFAKTFVGTPYYLSPEVIASKPYTWPSDVWSMGCILYQMCALKVPFEARSIEELGQKVLAAKIPSVPQEYSSSTRALCEKMMKRNPKDRPDTEGVINTPLIQEVVRKLLSEEKQKTVEEKPKIKHEIMDQFQRFDRNGDGVIDRSELAQVLKFLDSSIWTDEAINQIMAQVDRDRDGKIQFDEFVDWMFGGKSKEGLRERMNAKIKEAQKAADAENLPELHKALLSWRQAVDLGCLRVSPPEVSLKACECLSWLVLLGGGLIEGAKDQKLAYEAMRQMRAILQTVEQLLSESASQPITRIAAAASRTTLRGFCVELGGGVRLGQMPGGLTDDALDAVGATWTHLQKGEHIVQVSGGNASADGALLTTLILVTSYGRVLDFGKKGGPDKDFSLKASEGEEIESLIFSKGSVTGIKKQPIMVNWPKDQVDQVRNAFRAAVEAVWQVLLTMAWRMSTKHGSYALLEARRLGVATAKKLPLPDHIQAKHDEVAKNLKPPSHWDLSAMGVQGGGQLSPDAPGAAPKLKDSELKQLQALLNETYRRRPSSDPHSAFAPTGIEVVWGLRIQNWQTWRSYAVRREAIREDMREARPETKPSADSAGTSKHMEALGIRLDQEANVRWLFHGITTDAADKVKNKDFDIDVASPEAGRLYGRGVYMTELCSRVDKFAAEEVGGMHCMLLCRVMLGNALRDTAVLPDTVHCITQCTEGPYHSIVGDREEKMPGATRDYVVYDKDQVYPELLLWYKRVYAKK